MERNSRNTGRARVAGLSRRAERSVAVLARDRSRCPSQSFDFGHSPTTTRFIFFLYSVFRIVEPAEASFDTSPRTPMPPTATPAKVQHLEATDFQKSRGFSAAVITEGGNTVWLAGQTTVTDLEGKDISGKFDEQARTIFALINRTLERGAGSLANMVTMTVFINDARYGDRFVAGVVDED